MTDIQILRGGTMKVGDTRPPLRLKLTEDGDPINLTGHTARLLVKRSDADTLLIDSQITIDVESRGIVSYSWNVGETSEAGAYEIEVVTDTGTNEWTFPNRGTKTIYMEERLG